MNNYQQLDKRKKLMPSAPNPRMHVHGSAGIARGLIVATIHILYQIAEYTTMIVSRFRTLRLGSILKGT